MYGISDNISHPWTGGLRNIGYFLVGTPLLRWPLRLSLDDIGLDSIKVALRQAVARGAHPRRIFIRSSPISRTTKKKRPPDGWSFFFGGRYRTRTYDLPHVKRML